MNTLLCPAKRFLKRKLFPALLCMLLAQVASATDYIYQNLNPSYYDVYNTQVSPNPPPTIDATNFDNESVFSVSYQNYTAYPVLYNTWNTLNYTNGGGDTLIANSPNVTNGAIIFLSGIGSFGSGFLFDLHTTNQLPDQIAGTFYNAGAIRCDSTQDGNNIFTINLGGGLNSSFFELTSLGQFEVWATNVINPGSIDAGAGGLLQLKGQNVDLTGGTLTVEPMLNSLSTLGIFIFLNPIFNSFPAGNFTGTGAAGINTNVPWDPFFNLTLTTASSSFPDNLVISNLVAYTDDEVDPTTPNTIVHRAVFIQNYSPDGNVSANVYFDPLTSFSPFGLFFPGCVNVVWNANTIDPVTGARVNNFLYLTDDYIWGASTNAFVNFNGLPDNFVFTAPSLSPSQIPLFGPAVPATAVNYPDLLYTNPYSFFNGAVVANNVATNASLVDPIGSITNLPGAIKITASNTLNLAFANISGLNYLSLNCTNQFQGSPGAAIAAPFSDIALGVTNGFLVMSNVLTAGIPTYSGPVQAWSTRFFDVDTNTTPPTTNDFRVLLVFSSLEPFAPPWIQNLYLHGTNSLVVSDPLNVYGSFYSDAQVLTLNANPVGVGASSLFGQINWINPSAFNMNSGSGLQQMPNLLWVTNNGVIETIGTANFGNVAAPQFTVTPALPAPITNYTSFNNYGLITNQGMVVWTSYFDNGGAISNGIGSFNLHCGQAALTNGNIVAAGDVLVVATNVPQMGINGLTVSNQLIQAGRALTLVATNIAGDAVTNGNFWVVGANSGGGSADSGFNIPIKASGNLLGTTVTNISPHNKTIYNVWSGNDYGISNQGYTNNLALGHLVLDMLTTNTNPSFVFSGSGVSNALYVDLLELKDGAANSASSSPTNVYNLLWLKINPNMFIYYARAVRNVNGQLFDASEAIDDQSKIGANGGRLRWVYSYAGFYSSTNVYFTNSSGVVFTNTVNTPLAQSQTIDSDSDGIPNYVDPTPFFLSPELKFTAATTTLPPQSVKVQWTTIPNATNFIYFTTNLLSTNWLAFTNFQNWYYGNNVAVTNAAHGNSFHSPQVYINNPALPDNSQQTNVWIYDAITDVPHYYKVVVWPWINFPE